MASVASSPQLRLLRTLEAVVVIVAALYFGQPILVPLALAVLLTFLLTPLVKGLEAQAIAARGGRGFASAAVRGRLGASGLANGRAILRARAQPADVPRESAAADRVLQTVG